MDLECEGWRKTLEVFPDMDFIKELEEKPELSKFLKGAINLKSLNLENPLERLDCPKLDSDFSKFIVMTGLPICDEAKSVKLKALLVKLFSKHNFEISDEVIDMPFNDEGKTSGQAFIKLNTEEQAKISASIFNGHKLDAKHTFSSSTFPDFEKMMVEQ